MKTILGLDLGISSIGWSVIEENGSAYKILGLGTRIIPLNIDENDEFTKGNAISKNQARTTKRTLRKGYDRYDLRRKALKKVLHENGMMPDGHLLLKLTPLQLFGLRDKAVKEKLSLQEVGRVLLHLNQRRGYRSSKKEENKNGKVTEYEQTINNRFTIIQTKQKTIGQYFFEELALNNHFRVKEKVFPRIAYQQEFDAIWQAQQAFYPDILTAQLKDKVRNEIIFYQRNLKSQKGLVSFCEFEGNFYRNKEGKDLFAGPKVAPQSSPLAQVCKIWESINNITIKNRKGQEFIISQEKKKEIFQFLDNNERLSQAELFKILGIGKNEGYYANALISKKGIQGNTTKAALSAILEESSSTLLKFNIEEEGFEALDINTGEIINRKRIRETFENEPLYKLWHIIYSIPEEEMIAVQLMRKFAIPSEKAYKLARIDFAKGGFTKKSTRAMRKILPYLQQGLKYSDACLMAGYSHSDSVTREENVKRQLLNEIPLLQKGSLRQPVVEKILNGMINLVNAITKEYGKPDEIRVELARELKQSKDERNETFLRNNKTNAYHEKIRKHLAEHPEFSKRLISRRDIERYKLWEEFDGVSPYEPSKVVSLAELFSGLYDIEHIIPRSRMFDDGFGNKTICPRHLNAGEFGKNAMTAFEFMQKRSNKEFEDYLTCIEKNKKLSRSKRERLLMASDKIPADFIARQLRETQYIARRAREILQQGCYHVFATSGTVTQRLRELWGWNDVIMNLQLPKYRALGKTEWIELGNNGSTIKKEIITEWTKRDDHRHHAIDALAIACTQQGFIQRINTLNAQHSRDEMFKEIKDGDYNTKLSLLDNYLLSKKPFSCSQVEKACERILISYKTGKKVASTGRRVIKKEGKKIVVQKNIIVPRGPLSEETVYGKIKKSVQREVKLNTSFTDVEKIIDKNIRQKVIERLAAFENNPTKAFKNLSKNPVWLDEDKKQFVTSVIILDQKTEYVVKYPVQNIAPKDLEYVVDNGVKRAIEKRLALYNNNPKEAYKDLENNPIWLNEKEKIQVKTVRCFTGLNVVAPIRVKDEVQGITYEKYVKPGSNHHIAIYLDENGKKVEHVVTFWDAVERKKWGIPPVISNPQNVWSDLLERGIENTQLLAKLPSDKWKYVTSMQQNELFVFNMTKEKLLYAIEGQDYQAISPNLFRLRKISAGSYWFNHHYETTPRESVEDKKAGRCIQASPSSMTGIKVKLNHLGKIVDLNL